MLKEIVRYCPQDKARTEGKEKQCHGEVVMNQPWGGWAESRGLGGFWSLVAGP